MWLAYSIAVGALTVSCAVSLIALRMFRHVPRLPTNWSASGSPTSTAPNWIALGFIPLILLFGVTVVIVTKHRAEDIEGAVRGVALTAVFALFAQISHLILLRKHLSVGSTD